jgi:hypothetical protein
LKKNKKHLVWYGHVQRMDEEKDPQRILNWIPAGRRKRGRPKTRWKSCGRIWSTK